jgi:acyl-CoA synthetase (AMP-forming)/AMP-acid ligase II/acetyltransferase-like isoleucine patch superfamily enzyme/acyl carrier protein
MNAVSELNAVFHPDHSQPYQQPEAKSIYELLKRQAEVRPDAVAVTAPGRAPLTYARLLRQVQATVRSLRSSGVQRNDRVAIVLPNGPEMAASFVSIASGAACAPLNPSYKAEEFEFYLSDLNARAVILSSGAQSPARDVARALGIRVMELSSAAGADAGVFEFGGIPAPASENPDFAQCSDTALVLHTSGTTSRAKIVPLTHGNICASAHNIALTLQLTARDRCMNVMPLFHIHGLVGALMSSLTAGASVVCTHGFDPDKFFRWMDTFEPTWYSAVPTIHQAVLARASGHRDILARRPLRFIRSSSASLPPPVMRELETVFHTQVVEAYGMTEASHQMASNPLAPLPRKPGSVGMAAGPSMAIMDDAGNLLPPGEVGEVVIAGANVTQGYENNPAANQNAFTNGWFRTGDQGRFDADGYLYLTGRLKEIINRGGEKIAPREVDDVLSQHPAIAQAVAFAVPHATLGEEVAAAVVLKRDAHATPGEIRAFAAEHLADFKVPKQVLILDEIPKGATGKLQRIGLAEKLAGKLAMQRDNSFVAATTSVQTQLIQMWKTLLRVDHIGVRDDFQMLGGDSLATVTMLSQVKGRFNIDVSIEKFLRAPTIETLARLIEGKNTPVSGDQGPEAPRKMPAIRDSVLRGLKNRLLQWIALYIPGYTSTRVWLHRMRGVSIGSNTSIGLAALIETAYPSLVSIGNNVSIGMRAIIIGHLRDSTDRAREGRRHTVRIEDDAYIGPGVIILPNVTIGQGAVVSAGSVVSRSVPARTLVQGNPAKAVAHCGVSLGGGVSYEQFLRHLTPIDNQEPPAQP